MNIRIIVAVSILMFFPANYVMYILNYVFTNLFSIMDIFFLLCTSGIFLFKCVYLNLRIITLQYIDVTRTSLKATGDQDSRTWHKSHGWLKRARSAKEEETIFHWCMWKTWQISSGFVCSDWACIYPLIFPSFLDIFLLLWTSGVFFFLFSF